MELLVSEKRYAALIGLGLAAIGLVLVRLALGLVIYPLDVTSPDIAGVVASMSTNQFDAPEVRVVLTSGAEVTLRPDDRTLFGGPRDGDLIVSGSTPERWHIPGWASTQSDRPGCYSISADSAYSEPDGVVLVWSEWLGEGIRLPKAPGYEDSGFLSEAFGHLYYRSMEFGFPVSFCLDAEGRVTQFTH